MFSWARLGQFLSYAASCPIRCIIVLSSGSLCRRSSGLRDCSPMGCAWLCYCGSFQVCDAALLVWNPSSWSYFPSGTSAWLVALCGETTWRAFRSCWAHWSVTDRWQGSDQAIRSLHDSKYTGSYKVSLWLESNASTEPIASLSIPLLRDVTVVLERRGIAQSRLEGGVIHQNKIKTSIEATWLICSEANYSLKWL